MSKQRPIDELNATVTLTPALGKLAGTGASAAGLPSARAKGSAWHYGTTSAGEKVLVFTVRGEFAVDVADAGRRALLVTAPALVPIREVGEFYEADGTPVTAVLYDDPSVPSLTALTEPGALRAETARAIAGQVAEALDAARRRGVRHGTLDESRVFVDIESDSVQILGAGVENAASNENLIDTAADGTDPDVRSIGRILFVGLTGRTPEFFGGADVVDPALASPRTVPDDLAAVTRTLLTYVGTDPENPPYTVRAACTDLAPWQSLPVTLEAFDPEQHAGAPVPLSAATLAAMRGEGGTETAPTAARGITPISSDSSSGDASNADTAERPVVHGGGPSQDASSGSSAATGAAAGVMAGAGAAGAYAGASLAQSRSDARSDDAMPEAGSGTSEASQPWGDVVAHASTFPGSAKTEEPATAAFEMPSPSEGAGNGPIRVAGRSESLAATLGSRPAQPDFATRASQTATNPRSATTANPAPDIAAKRPTVVPPSAVPQPDQSLPVGMIPVKGRPLNPRPEEAQHEPSLFRDVVSVALGSDETATAAPSSSSRGTQSKIIIAAAVLALLLALVFAITSLTSVGRNRGVTSNPTTAEASESKAPATVTKPATTKPAEEKPEVKPATLDSVKVIYPEDQSKADYPEKADLMTDGDPKTAWKSQRYAGPDFGGTRTGMGLQLAFPEVGKVSEVGVTAGEQEGGTIEVRTVDDSGNVGNPVGKGVLSKNAETVIKLDEPVEAQQLVLWAPDLGAVKGGYRIEVAELRVG